MSGEAWDAVVVGGGPAGLSAALWLARYRRRTLVLDDARPRNEAAWAVHGYPGLPDPTPVQLRQRIAEQATTAGAVLERCRVDRVSGSKGEFVVEVGPADRLAAHRVVLAYGRRDRVPSLPGLNDFYGTTVFHCPDCDGPGMAGCELAVLGHDRAAAGLALYLLTWAEGTTLVTNGLEPELDADAVRTLEAEGVAIRSEPVEALEGGAGQLARVTFDGAPPLEVQGLFFHWGTAPSSTLAQRAGCACDEIGDIQVDRRTMETSVPGIHAAGDIVGHPHLAITAAAQGVRAALAAHRSLLPASWQLEG
ncbi:MAG TPA: NAD(P)/FAD-dependent oxidoreductase [Longimicrobiales bacterium]|nr:NAD(P)/FAD-dependent oxidoreductase [Longimicrobiales bacterium]